MFVEERTPGGVAARTHFGVLAGSRVNLAPKEGLVNPRMPTREDLAGCRGAERPGQSLAKKEPTASPGVVGNHLQEAWETGSELILGAH